VAIYAIGDLHGQLSALHRLLKKINYKPGKDQLWFTGDLVNRGPDSLGCLRFVKNLGNQGKTVLGNHDLALLAYAHGNRQFSREAACFDTILAAPDAPQLLEWLQNQPLIHHDSQLDFTLVHAGIPPCWTLEQALDIGAQTEEFLKSKYAKVFLKSYLFGDTPSRLTAQLSQVDRMRFVLNAFTRMRYLEKNGQLEFKCKTPPAKAPAQVIPWYAFPNHPAHEQNIVFGHWAALGETGTQHPHIHHIDTGCAWGGKLTAIKLTDKSNTVRLKRISIDCPA
jgi:bis(5'-nucleosyl)-tetraphosphatase (symmetrical)